LNILLEPLVLEYRDSRPTAVSSLVGIHRLRTGDGIVVTGGIGVERQRERGFTGKTVRIHLTYSQRGGRRPQLR